MAYFATVTPAFIVDNLLCMIVYDYTRSNIYIWACMIKARLIPVVCSLRCVDAD